jgi:hypothetical protein
MAPPRFTAAELRAVARHLEQSGSTACPPCRRGELPHLGEVMSAAGRMHRLWSAMRGSRAAAKKKKGAPQDAPG